MGHLSSKTAYLDLQRRLDRMPIGAPAHRALIGILEELLNEEEARVAAAIPLRVTTVDRIASNAGMDENRTSTILRVLAEKGFVVDLPRGERQTLYYLNPTIIGFFEFTMMRVREDVDQKRVAELMWEYLREDRELAFLNMLGAGETFIARPLVNETVVRPEIHSEVLDWEKASAIVDEAGSWAEGVCHCRHVKLHLGARCDYPLEHCLSLGMGADYLVRNGMAERIDRSRARDVLEHAREHGNVQMADNVRDNPTFICNCCKCCCEMMEGFRTLPTMATVVSSSFEARTDTEQCTGCGKCAKACPIDAIEMVPADGTAALPKRRKRAQVDHPRCLGCGVCPTACEFDAVSMEHVGQRVYTPESMMEKVLLQAVERGKVQHLLFNDPGRLTHRTLGAFLTAVLSLPPAQRAMANRQLKSRFVEMLLSRFKGSVEERVVLGV